jgi:hypothetical protein
MKINADCRLYCPVRVVKYVPVLMIDEPKELFTLAACMPVCRLGMCFLISLPPTYVSSAFNHLVLSAKQHMEVQEGPHDHALSAARRQVEKSGVPNVL